MDRRAKVELVEVLRERYVASEKQAKSRILDELVQITVCTGSMRCDC